MNGDVSEILALAADLSLVGPKMVKPVLGVLDEMGNATALAWRGIAEVSSGETGRLYPPTIDHTARGTFGGNLEVEIGPNAALGASARAGRGYEFGSVNQPPHLDGLKATTAAEPRVGKALDSAIGFLIP
ncbi:MAG: hypothetical protein LH630_05045 [Actinomycetia bacterium]|nr:hypothetical protein [Actinomycetes bacterium]